MKILTIVAGTNEPSNSDTLANAFIQGLQHNREVQIDKIRLKDLHIEHFTLDNYEPQCRAEEDFCTMQNLMQAADGFVIATPIWNFGVPAHLKNLIDRMGSFALDETRSRGTLNGKPFYMIFTGGAPSPAWKTMMRRTTSFVPEALQYFGASYLGHHFEGKCTKGKGVFGLVVDDRPQSIASVRKKGVRFAHQVEEFIRTGKAPLAHRSKATAMQWGEKVLKKLF